METSDELGFGEFGSVLRVEKLHVKDECPCPECQPATAPATNTTISSPKDTPSLASKASKEKIAAP